MFKIGTRGSLLAVTQSTLIKEQLERISGKKFELVLIKTQGDQVTDKPLWQLDGKDFFTKELDEALLKGEVDLVVHSYKDLGSERPVGIELGAITERRFAHDVLLISKKTVEELPRWKGKFVVGTSSPRRIVNLGNSLKSFLPVADAQIECAMLRGNINTRIQKLKDGQYHAITLALAGLERLAQLPSSHQELSRLLEGLTFAVLPLSVFPSAAAQGALALEISPQGKHYEELKPILSSLHHLPTAEAVGRERKAFKEYGGGCHLAVGIHVRSHQGDFLHFHRGTKEVAIEVKAHEKKIPTFHGAKVFYHDELFKKIPFTTKVDLSSKHVFFTTKHALGVLDGRPQSLWSAGSESWKLLSSKGYWVNGSADNMGVSELERLNSSQALRIMTGEAPWAILSHDKATHPWGTVVPSYIHRMQLPSAELAQTLKTVSHAWWSSYPQYEAYVATVPEMKNAQHFCGLGKTLSSFQERGIAATGLIDSQEFLQLAGLR